MSSESPQPTHLTCEDVEALISGIVDGELDRDTRHAAELHLQNCPACRAKVNQAEALDGLVAAAGERQGPDVLPERVRLGVIGAVDRDRARTLRHPVFAWSGWALAAALALLLTVGSLAGWLGGGRGPGGPPGPRLQLAADEREAVSFIHILADAMAGDLSQADYDRTLNYLRQAQAELGESLVSRLLGDEERAALSALARRPGLTDAQRQVLQLADALVTDLERGEPIERERWRQLDSALDMMPMS